MQMAYQSAQWAQEKLNKDNKLDFPQVELLNSLEQSGDDYMLYRLQYLNNGGQIAQ